MGGEKDGQSGQSLGDKVAGFFGLGSGKKGEDAKERSLQQIIQSLEGEPMLQCFAINHHVHSIADSGDDNFVEYVVNVLAKNSFYEPLEILSFSSIAAEKIRKLNLKYILDLVDHMIEGDPLINGMKALSLLDGFMQFTNDDVAKSIGRIIIKPGFYEERPITALKKAISIVDIEAIGTIFAYVIREGNYSASNNENGEIQSFRSGVVDVKRLAELPYLEATATEEKERESLRKELTGLQEKLSKAYKDLITREPIRVYGKTAEVFEKAGEVLLALEETVNNELRVGDYRHAMECFIESGNAEKILDAVQRANSVTEPPQSYDAAVAAFNGVRAILTNREVGEIIKGKAIEELKKTFASPLAYSANPGLAIKAAELSGDFSILRENFYLSIQKSNSANPDVYAALKEHGEVKDDVIIALARNSLKSIISGTKDINLMGVVASASLVQGQTLDKSLLTSAIAIKGLGFNERYEALAGLKYMKDRGMMNPAEERFYDSIKKK